MQKRGLHFCIGFCKLNARTKKDSYPLPQIQESVESLVGAGYFYLDLTVSFWQIAMDEVSKQYTVFTVGNLGFFKCKWMPFGQCNVQATFQRLMKNCLGTLNLTYCLVYLDNDSLLKDEGGAFVALVCCVQLLLGAQSEDNVISVCTWKNRKPLHMENH